MKFQEYLEKIKPKIRAISYKAYNKRNYIDVEDIEQEICIHLWEKFKNGEIENNTESYILQGCWFFAKNYLRKNNKTGYPANEESELNRLYNDNQISKEKNELTDIKIDLDYLKDYLTQQEKKVLYLTLEGYTLREIADMMEISFPRVSKVRKNIRKKSEEINSLG
ncbi:MAG: sigma-70 family RNA polymerase sigma factor [Elusimicrobiota bacterium]